MKKSLTIADIADALHLSRNTVSKALNGKHVSPKTKQLILDTAVQMGYKSFDLISAAGVDREKDRKILLLSSVPLLTANYYIYLVRGIMAEAERYGLEILQYVLHSGFGFETVKRYINQFDINGIICIEFFNSQGVEEILSLNIPTVFLDICCDTELNGEYDVIMSENTDIMRTVCRSLIETGAKHFSFVGNPYNCKSFFERYIGLRTALIECGKSFDASLSILKDNFFPYGSVAALKDFYVSLPQLPDVIVCANDFIALNVLDAIRQIHYVNLQNINIIGFDNIPESRLKNPKLSTVNIDKQALGQQAVRTLIERINLPQLPCRYFYLRNTFIKRETTPLFNRT